MTYDAERMRNERIAELFAELSQLSESVSREARQDRLDDLSPPPRKTTDNVVARLRKEIAFKQSIPGATWADVPIEHLAALLDIHDAARAMLQEEYPPQEAENRARLCMALNACDRGVAEHDWGEWRGPYVASGGDLWQSRSCRTCGEHDSRRMPKDGDA